MSDSGRTTATSLRDWTSPATGSSRLEPLIPQRTPSDELGFRYGFQLRIPDGPLIDADDPLLAGLGAEVVPVLASALHEEELQSEDVDPGKSLRACVETPNEDGELAVGVWAGDGSCSGAGELPPATTAQRVAAIMSAGLDVQVSP